MNARELAKLAGISVRTLHHYDEIGLLCPGRDERNGYRRYGDAEMDRLQQILFFRRCGFSLERIKTLLDRPDFDREEAYRLQEKMLLSEIQRLETTLDTLRKSFRANKGEITMSKEEKFRGFDMTENPYEEEARRLWGDETIDRSNAYIRGLAADGREAVAKGMDALFESLAQIRTEDPRGARAQQAMDRMYSYFNANFGHHYSLEAFAGLGRMYVDDPRFTENIDRYGAGLSEFLAEAMGAFAEENDPQKH